MGIIAIDPGSTTGFAIMSNHKFRAYQINLTDYPHPHEVLYDHLCEIKPTSIIYEAFLHRQGHSGVVYTGVEFIGVVCLWGQQNQVTTHKINPSDGKAFWTDVKLKALDMYVKGIPHGMDALRVLFTHLSKTNKTWSDDMIEKLRSTIRLA